LFLSDFNESLIFSNFFFYEKYSDITFRENPSGEIRVVPSGQKDGRTGGWTGGQTEARRI